MPSPHVTRAADSTTAAGTVQPLTCGRPRQTDRRSAMSGIRGCQRGSSEHVRPPKPTRKSTEGEVLWVSPNPGGSVPIIVTALDREWRIRAHRYL